MKSSTELETISRDFLRTFFVNRSCVGTKSCKVCWSLVNKTNKQNQKEDIDNVVSRRYERNCLISEALLWFANFSVRIFFKES